MIKSRRMRWAGAVARMWEKRNAYRILVGKPEGRRPLGRQRRRWVDNIKMDVRKTGWYGKGWDGMNWIYRAQDRGQWSYFVNAVIGSDEPSGSLKCWVVPKWLHNWQLLRKGSAPYVRK
jgi:hypothetical protein